MSPKSSVSAIAGENYCDFFPYGPLSIATLLGIKFFKCFVANQDFTFLSLIGMETVVCGMDVDGCCGDGNDIETIARIGPGMGIRVVGMVGIGINFCTHAALLYTHTSISKLKAANKSIDQ